MKKILILSLIISLSGCALNKESQDLPEPETSSMEAPIPQVSDVAPPQEVPEPPTLQEPSGQDAPVQLGHERSSETYKKVQEALKKENPSEIVEAFSMPQRDGLVYFATSGNEEFDVFSETYFSTLKVYSYDLSTSETNLIYEGEQDIFRRLLGLDGQELIFAAYQNPDYSPGPCSSPWLDSYISLESLNLDTPDKIRPYTTPQTMIERETSLKAQCEEELGFK